MEVRIENLSKTYPNGVKALENVSLTIPRGMYGLLGPNGASKGEKGVRYLFPVGLASEGGKRCQAPFPGWPRRRKVFSSPD
jgi:ABC-type uncharacterized transport system ATPase subunit